MVMDSKLVKKVLPIVWGFGFATLLRSVCRSELCTRYTMIEPKDINFKNGKSCMNFESVHSECNTQTQTDLSKPSVVSKSNFNFVGSDILVVIVALVVLFFVCKYAKSNFYTSATTFLIVLLIGMYLGPIQKEIKVFPTHLNLDTVYKRNNACFRYKKNDTECTKGSVPLPT